MITKLLEALKNDSSEISSVYAPLFRILAPNNINQTLEWVYDIYAGIDTNYHKDDWFFAFHKSIRQTDFFQNCFTEIKTSTLTEDEYVEYGDLKAKISNAWKALTKEQRMETTVYSWAAENLPTEWKDNQVDRESINGNLDSVLWNLIHVDTKGVLSSVLEKVFKQHKYELDLALGIEETTPRKDEIKTFYNDFRLDN